MPANSPHSLPDFVVPRVAAVVQGGASLLWLPQAALLAWTVQGMLDGRDSQAAWMPAVGVVLLGGLRACGEAWAGRAMHAAARQHLSDLRSRVVAALAHRSPFDPQRAQSGLAASVVAEQAEAVIPFLLRFQPARWKVTLIPLLILIAVAPLSWVAALILLVAAPLIPVFMALVGMGAQAASRAQMVEMGGMNAFLLDRLRGLATLRALGAIDATAERLDVTAQSVRSRTMAVLRIAFLSSAVLELFSALGVAMVAAYIGFSLLGTFHFGAWGHRLTLAEGLFILLLAPAFFEPLRELAAAWHDKAAGQAALASLNDLANPDAALDLLSGAGDAKPLGILAGAAPSVQVDAVYFSHAGQLPLFDGLSLQVGAGEHVALLGASGAGKTTLLSLLAGLLPAGAGEIRIAGVRLDDDSADALRGRMAWMGQRAHVFPGSVSDNVTLGRASDSDLACNPVDAARVRAALQLAGLGGVVQAQPQITLCEAGQGLSGGEAVRMALARVAFHPHADLLLVDEPTAHLDSETAARVTDALLLLARGKTMLVATHDPLLASRLQRSVVLGLGATDIRRSA